MQKYSIEETDKLKDENDWKQLILLVSESALSSIVSKTQQIISDVCKKHCVSHGVYLDISERISKEVDIFRLYESQLTDNDSLEVKVLEKDWKCLGVPKSIKWDLSNYKSS